MILDRELKPGQLWFHYKHPANLYEIIGISVASKETVSQALYVAKKEDTLENLGVYITSKGNLKLYKVKLNDDGTFKTLTKVVKEPHVIYQSKVDGQVWARLYDNFVEVVSTGEGTNFYRFTRVE